jgi:AraC-like DNA-binding protein
VKKKLKLSAADKEALLLVKQLIDQHPDALPSLKSLCRKSGLNEDKLKKGFTVLYGQCIKVYHGNLRMEEARRLLQHTEKSVTEIGYELGYGYGNNFCAAFKRFTGVTALAWRNAVTPTDTL